MFIKVDLGLRDRMTVAAAHHGSFFIILSMIIFVCVGQPIVEDDKFENDFKTRCNNLNRYDEDNRKDCGTLWASFLNGFCDKEDSKITKDNYNNYATAAKPELHESAVTFYSGLKERGINEDYVTISRTMLGGPVNGTHWISAAERDGCYKTQDKCKSNTENMFWRRVSQEYATLASGTVRVFLSGKFNQSFGEHTIFAQEELPNLNRDRVSRVIAYVVAYRKNWEKCTTGSLSRLKHLVEKVYRLGKFECEDDQEKVNEHCSNVRRMRADGGCWEHDESRVECSARTPWASTTLCLVILGTIKELMPI